MSESQSLQSQELVMYNNNKKKKNSDGSISSARLSVLEKRNNGECNFRESGIAFLGFRAHNRAHWKDGG